MDDFMTYYDIMADLANDRNDEYDPEYRDPEGYCPHGNYVGGSGADLMCQWCEDGYTAEEVRAIYAAERLAGIRERAERAAKLLDALLRHGVGGIDAADWAQESSYIGNPPARYGRH